CAGSLIDRPSMRRVYRQPRVSYRAWQILESGWLGQIPANYCSGPGDAARRVQQQSQVTQCPSRVGRLRLLQKATGMFEHRQEALITRAQFVRRIVGSFAVTLLIAGASLAVGTTGYHIWGELPWLDSFH